MPTPPLDSATVVAHTPGPWTTRPLGDAVLILPAYHAPRRLGLATDRERDRDLYAQIIATVRTDRHGRGSTEANARIIAAAPALYGALKDLVQWIDTGVLVDDEGWAEVAADVKVARAALSLATPAPSSQTEAE